MDEPGRAARRAYETRVGESPEAVAVAPGRVTFVGGHVDYNEGVVLPVPIDRVAACRTLSRLWSVARWRLRIV